MAPSWLEPAEEAKSYWHKSLTGDNRIGCNTLVSFVVEYLCTLGDSSGEISRFLCRMKAKLTFGTWLVILRKNLVHTHTHCDDLVTMIINYILSRVFSANCEGVSRLGTPGCDDTNAVLHLQKFELEHAGCV